MEPDKSIDPISWLYRRMTAAEKSILLVAACAFAGPLISLLVMMIVSIAKLNSSSAASTTTGTFTVVATSLIIPMVLASVLVTRALLSPVARALQKLEEGEQKDDGQGKTGQ